MATTLTPARSRQEITTELHSAVSIASSVHFLPLSLGSVSLIDNDDDLRGIKGYCYHCTL